MACWNSFIPYLVPDLPAAQKDALAFGIKGPLVYTSVAVKNWTAFQKLSVASINAPTLYHTGVSLSEAAASPHTDAAMLEAHRAVQVVLQRRAMPLLTSP